MNTSGSTQARLRGRTALAGALLLTCLTALAPSLSAQQSVARQWNELLLESIRHDLARPTVHARNLYHISAAMYDAWATYDTTAKCVLFGEKHATTGPDVDEYRGEAISYAAYTLLRERFALSPGFALMSPQYDAKMAALGFDKSKTSTVGNSPSAIGLRIANNMIAYGLSDGSNEAGGYANLYYTPKNAPLVVALAGNPSMTFPDNWQPLALSFFIDQNGNLILGGYPPALTPEWGNVLPFSLKQSDNTVYFKDGHNWNVYHDPGPPFHFQGPTAAQFKDTFELDSTWSSHLDPSDGVMWDASPNHIGKAVLPADPSGYSSFYDKIGGGDNGTGYAVNPVTGQPYDVQMVPRGDYTRCLAEFWADGPTSETPPGHWFFIFNHVADDPNLVKRIGGTGPIVNNLEWDVKGYIALGGALHDCAVACWGIKGYYDGVRPISAIRYLADHGQCTDPLAASYSADGIDLIPDYIELLTPENTAAGAKHEDLAGYEGKIAIKAWRGPPYIVNPATDVAGVGWILAENWWPYQRPSFVTPPFPGYTSGHSTYSRAGAVIMSQYTGSTYFPGGLGEFDCPQNQYLVFEDGPSVTVKLQWASYFDASDQCSLSRIWGGIHPPMDDIPARKIGEVIGGDAWTKATHLWSPWTSVGTGLAGTNGVPSLVGSGPLTGGSANELSLTGAKAFAPAVLAISFTGNPVPFKGGTLVANPVDFVMPLVTVFDGSIHLPFTWPNGIPSNVSLWFQDLISDNAAPYGVAVSNAVRADTP
jgi:Domain of unknown function (DUF6851)